MKVSSVTTTEVCNLSCKMCHFNGPTAIRKFGVLTVEEVRKFLQETPPQGVWFAGTGEFFMDPNALEHLRVAVELGHKPHILTNGQLLTPELIDELLEIGVRWIRISVDAIEHDQYSKVRQGGDLSKILDACAYLKSKKKEYPDLLVEVMNTLFLNTFKRQDEFIDFWRGKVDAVGFNAEYYDIFKFRNKFFEPKERNDCEMSVYLLPTGQMAPCCAMMVYQHYHNVDWLPHISNTSPSEAYDQFVRLYNDPESDFRKNICSKCEWWIMWARDEQGNTPYYRHVPLTDSIPNTSSLATEAETDSSQFVLQDVESTAKDVVDELKLQTELEQARARIKTMQSSRFWKMKVWFDKVKHILFQAQDSTVSSQLSDALGDPEAELTRLLKIISQMEGSKFWKLRIRWFQLKEFLGLTLGSDNSLS